MRFHLYRWVGAIISITMSCFNMNFVIEKGVAEFGCHSAAKRYLWEQNSAARRLGLERASH